MNKRVIPTIASTCLFLILLTCGSLNLGEANSSYTSASSAEISGIGVSTYLENGGSIPPSQVGAKPPTITISPIENNSSLNVNNFNLTITATSGNSILNTSRWIDTIYYKVDWQQKNTYVYRYMNDELNPFDYSTSFNLTGINGTIIPEGKHTLTVYAIEEGQFFHAPVPSEVSGLKKIVYNSFQIEGSTSVSFAIDRTAPNITVLSIENTTYSQNAIPLNFTINEPVSKLAYNLDTRGNNSVIGNITLTDLSVGEHKLIIYAWDVSGNVGASETLVFTIAETFPMLILVIVASSVVIILLVVMYFLLYRRHRKTAMSRKIS